MLIKQKISLVAIAVASITLSAAATAAQSDGTLVVNATLVSACTVSPGATISFGEFSAQKAGDTLADSGATFQVACSADLTPAIFAIGARTVTNGANTLPFNLSLTAGADLDDLPLTLGAAEDLTMTQDGTPQEITLYAKALTADYAGLPGGIYTAGLITVSVSY
ncbi:MAG: spore coat protein U domain-containing protein [Gammaproteobacteria bacterium]